jgi:hypothetical protein
MADVAAGSDETMIELGPGPDNRMVALPFGGIPRRMSFRLADDASIIIGVDALYWDGVALSPDQTGASGVRLIEYWKGAFIPARGDHILQAVVSWHEGQPKCSCSVGVRLG